MKPAGTQTDVGLGFDGAEQVSRRDSSKKYSGNQHGGQAGGNYGRGPTKGNHGSRTAGPVSASGKEQKRNPGGTRAWDPQCCGNYKGNPDRQNVGRGPTKGNQQ